MRRSLQWLFQKGTFQRRAVSGAVAEPPIPRMRRF
nr:MAG TPA: hypothetical protein [Caudoviricetes sp.]